MSMSEACFDIIYKGRISGKANLRTYDLYVIKEIRDSCENDGHIEERLCLGGDSKSAVRTVES